MRTTKLTILVLIALVSTEPLLAQGVQPGEQKSARQLVAEYATLASGPGDRGIVGTPFHRGCPREDPRRDSIFEALLEIEPTDAQRITFADAWGGFLEQCNDPRLDAWFQRQARSSRNMYVLMTLAFGLLRTHPTDENVAVVREVTFDTTLNDETRTMLLREMIHDSPGLSVRARVDLLAELYEKTGRIPEPYYTGEVAAFRNSAEARYWRTRLTDALLRNPRGQGSLELLQALGTDAISEAGDKDPEWVSRFHGVLLRLERDMAVPDNLRRGALRTRELVEKNRGQPPR